MQQFHLREDVIVYSPGEIHEQAYNWLEWRIRNSWNVLIFLKTLY